MKKQLPGGTSAVIIVSVVVLALVLIGLAPRRQGSRDEPKPGPRTGSASRPISGKTTAGRAVALADFKGKVVLINFWATWCGPCRQEMPEIIALHNKYKDRGLVVLSIASDDTQGPVDALLKDSPLPFTVIYGTDDMKRTYAVNALPTTVLIDKSGQIVYDVDGYDPKLDFGALIEKHL